MLDAVAAERGVDLCMKRVVNPRKPELTDILVGYLKKVFLARDRRV